MTASRNLYEKVADVLAGERSLALHDNDASALIALRNVTFSIADAFAQDNPRFNRLTFYAAADPILARGEVEAAKREHR